MSEFERAARLAGVDVKAFENKYELKDFDEFAYEGRLVERDRKDFDLGIGSAIFDFNIGTTKGGVPVILPEICFTTFETEGICNIFFMLGDDRYRFIFEKNCNYKFSVCLSSGDLSMFDRIANYEGKVRVKGKKEGADISDKAINAIKEFTDLCKRANICAQPTMSTIDDHFVTIVEISKLEEKYRETHPEEIRAEEIAREVQAAAVKKVTEYIDETRLLCPYCGCEQNINRKVCYKCGKDLIK